MKEIQLINKKTKEKIQLNADTVRIDQSSIVKIKISKSDIVQMSQDGTNLILVLRNGERLVVENFYANNHEGLMSSLVIEEQSGTLYWFDEVTKQYKQISRTDTLLPSSSFLAENWEWIAIGTLLIGGVAATDSGEVEDDEQLELNEPVPIDPGPEVPVEPEPEIPVEPEPEPEVPIEPEPEVPVEPEPEPEVPVDPEPEPEVPVEPEPEPEVPVEPEVPEPEPEVPIEPEPEPEVPVEPEPEPGQLEPTNPILRLARLNLVEQNEYTVPDQEAVSRFKTSQEFMRNSSEEQQGAVDTDHDVIPSDRNEDIIDAKQLIDFISSGLDSNTQVYKILNTADAISNLNNQMNLLLEGTEKESSLMDIDFMRSDTVSLAELLSDSSHVDNIIVVGNEGDQIIIQTDAEEVAQASDPLILENQSDLMLQQLLSEQQQIIG
ncbi:BapA/Bap/LapF family prefix-like domain-containing protein [Acinetobacter schindleri]|uniref:BapA prefix-like domain-containing protein n=1 Tax=Acinetobacter schindleri TaxID=108981 RepID=A0AAE7BXH2_9GAMM|nr:BapA prefix-like domain-containing protein [Acinetobacter schindleri]QIC67389.1 BapA prefix-like domain-containing protein [Acinetobacter schindleri]UOH76107.1 BapA prefix-like domain-containing protein [Acinetobacter schindleri]